jgi:hypothetical protein
MISCLPVKRVLTKQSQPHAHTEPSHSHLDDPIFSAIYLGGGYVLLELPSFVLFFGMPVFSMLWFALLYLRCGFGINHTNYRMAY